MLHEQVTQGEKGCTVNNLRRENWQCEHVTEVNQKILFWKNQDVLSMSYLHSFDV